MNRKIPIHLFIPGEVQPDNLLLKTIGGASWLGISSTWVEIHKEEELNILKNIFSSLPTEFIPVINDASVIKVLVEKGISRIVISPLIAEELLKLKEEHKRKIGKIYFSVKFKSEESFIADLNEAVIRTHKLKKAGIEDVFIHIYHPDPVIQFNLSRLMKERYSTRHIISFTPFEKGEKSVLLNTLSLGSLFYEGIGEELLLQVSPTAEFSEETLAEMVDLVKKILGACRLFPTGYRIISCPTCGRCKMDLLKMTEEIDQKLRLLEKQYKAEGKELEKVGGVTVAVMGCNVNGPGEARNADIGIAGRGNKTGILFKNGKPFKTLPENRLADELISHTRAFIENKFKAAM